MQAIDYVMAVSMVAGVIGLVLAVIFWVPRIRPVGEERDDDEDAPAM